MKRKRAGGSGREVEIGVEDGFASAEVGLKIGLGFV